MGFIVARRPVGERIVNEAHNFLFPAGKENVMTPVPLADNHGSWAAGFNPGTKVWWVSQKDRLNSYDFTDNAAIKVGNYEGAQSKSANLSPELREALQGAREKKNAAEPLSHQKLPPAASAPTP